jgi:hypothetical protein
MHLMDFICTIGGLRLADKPAVQLNLKYHRQTHQASNLAPWNVAQQLNCIFHCNRGRTERLLCRGAYRLAILKVYPRLIWSSKISCSAICIIIASIGKLAPTWPTVRAFVSKLLPESR